MRSKYFTRDSVFHHKVISLAKRRISLKKHRQSRCFFLVPVTGVDGLCPSFASRTPDYVRLRRRGFESLVFKATKKEEQPQKCDFSSFGAPEGTRTPDLLVRSQTLYPTELPAHMERMTRLELATSTLARWRSTR